LPPTTTRRVLDLEHRLAGRLGALDPAEQHRAADHHLGDLFAGGVGGVHGADDPAVAQHGDPVGDLEHLVQRVGDEDDRLALGLELAQVGEQLLDLLGDEHGGRLVEDQDVGAAVQQLQDLDALLLADGQVLDPGAGIEWGAEAAGQLPHPPFGLVEVQAPPWPGSAPSTTFSATVKSSTSMKCWWTMPMRSAIALRGESILSGWPLTRISPSSGCSRP
jgi:hypothetical protein